MSYKLPSLPYDFNDLEPVISGQIMELHYTKHHQTYVNNLNQALEKYQEAEKKNDISKMIALQQTIKFNGGGHINHSIFWTNLASPQKGGGHLPKGELEKMIASQWGSLEKFIETFSALTVAIQGSGWGWLGYNPATKQLSLSTCNNQDPLAVYNQIPLLGIDVWEHAYYLQYKNVRADYVKNIWKIVNWENVEQRLLTSKGS